MEGHIVDKTLAIITDSKTIGFNLTNSSNVES